MSDDLVAALLETARRLAFRWTRSPHEADDVAQEAVIRLLALVVMPTNVTGWLFVVIRRLANRRRLREQARVNAELAFVSSARQGDLSPELLIDIRSLLGRLNGRDARLLTSVARGAVASEIAREFDCEVRDVGQMVARARRKVRRLMFSAPS